MNVAIDDALVMAGGVRSTHVKRQCQRHDPILGCAVLNYKVKLLIIDLHCFDNVWCLEGHRAYRSASSHVDDGFGVFQGPSAMISESFITDDVLFLLLLIIYLLINEVICLLNINFSAERNASELISQLLEMSEKARKTEELLEKMEKER